jgi:hypothetical protein
MSTLRTLRNYERVQEKHDEAFDRAFATKREAERILALKRVRAHQVRITVSSEKRNLLF